MTLHLRCTLVSETNGRREKLKRVKMADKRKDGNQDRKLDRNLIRRQKQPGKRKETQNVENEQDREKCLAWRRCIDFCIFKKLKKLHFINTCVCIHTQPINVISKV